MPQIQHALYSFEIPEAFEIKYEGDIIVEWGIPNYPSKIRNPIFSLSLNKIESYASMPGETIAERCYSNLGDIRQGAQTTLTREVTLHGCPTYIQYAKTDTELFSYHVEINHYLAYIVINDRYLIEVTFDVETKDGPEYEPIFDAILSSLSWDTTREQCDALWDAYVNGDDDEDDTDDLFSLKEETSPPLDLTPPSTPEDLVEIGDLTWHFVEEECSYGIDDSGDFFFSFVVITPEREKGESLKILDSTLGRWKENGDYEKDGSLALSASFRGIRKDGKIEAKHEFKEGKTGEPFYYTTRISGGTYGLDFDGTITISDTWIGMVGTLGKDYLTGGVYPIRIWRRYDAASLDYTKYVFTREEEFIGVPPESVRSILFMNPTFEKIPESIFWFRELRKLAIIDSFYSDVSWEDFPLASIDDRIGTLGELEELTLSGKRITEIPKSIGNLSKLSRLWLGGMSLTTIPSEVFWWGSLTNLSLNRCGIISLPEHIDLPALEDLDLSRNNLKTLPTALFSRSPKLRRLNLDENPWESLPQEVGNIEDLDLSIEDRQRLLDHWYRGAWENGVIEWDDSIFFIDRASEQAQALREQLSNNEYRETLEKLAKKSITFTHTDDPTDIVWQTRFGGMPDLPLDIEYPTFYNEYTKRSYLHEFIAQINCEEIRDLQDYLPKKGILFFFLETTENISRRSPRQPCKIIYVEDTARLVSGSRFHYTQEDYQNMYGNGEGSAYVPRAVRAEVRWGLPYFYSMLTNQYMFYRHPIEFPEDVLEFDAVREALEKDIEYAKVDYAMNDYGFTQHESPELQASLRLKGNPEDWIILLKVTSTGDFQWGDAGELFFVIHKSDLMRGDFSNVFVTMESS